jgi:hypothetical protein
LDSVIVDGFPRTTVQVECLKMLRDKLNQLRHSDSPQGMGFRYFSFSFSLFVCVLRGGRAVYVNACSFMHTRMHVFVCSLSP